MLGIGVGSGAAVTPARRRWSAAVLVLPLALLLAACGEPPEDDAPTPPAPIPDAAPFVPPAAAAPEAAPAAVPVAPAVPAATPPANPPTPPAPVPAAAADPIPAVAPVADAAPAAPVDPAPVAAPDPVVAVAPGPVAGPGPMPVAPAEPVAVAPVEPAPAPPATPAIPDAAPPVPPDPALVARLAAADAEAGRRVAARCGSCHAFEPGAPSGNGPNLYDIVGAPVGAVPGFDYSPAFTALAASGATWTFELLDAFLADPSVTVPGTRMGFGGLADDAERANLVAYLRTLSDDPVPLPGVDAVDTFRADIMAFGRGPVTFTTEQVQIGRDYYRRYCSTCHGLSFEGIFYGMEWGEAPPLAGERFERRWFLRSLGEFVATMEETDILNYASLHAGLSPDRYVAIAAYLLEQYGFTPGDVPLPIEPQALRGIGFWQ